LAAAPYPPSRASKPSRPPDRHHPPGIEGIQARPAAEQALFIGKLAGQVALERTVERVLLARRMLLTGMRDPHVSATPAPRQLQSFLAELEREIDNLLFETRVRKELSSRTADLLLRDEGSR
jgi:hypothetical protein